MTGDFLVLKSSQHYQCPHQRDEPTLPKTVQCTVLVGEKSLQQQALQAVPENGVALAPFETAGNPKDCLRGFFTQVQTALPSFRRTEGA
jgi:hypothetical protein